MPAERSIRPAPTRKRPEAPKEDDGGRAQDLSLFIESTTGIAIFLLDPDGRVLTWNAGAELMHGYTAQEIVGQPAVLLYSGEDVSAGIPELALRTARKEGRFAGEGWRVRKDGSQFWANVVVTAIRTPAGVLRGYGEIAYDETARKRAEDDLRLRSAELATAIDRLASEVVERERAERGWRSSEYMYRAVMSALQPHIAVLDRAGNIVVVNEAWERFARENGEPPPEKVGAGANYLDVCQRAASESVEEARQTLEALQAILHGAQNSFTLEYPCHSPGENRWFLLSMAPWKLDGGGAVVSHTDISERVLAERKLKESEEHYRALIENEVDVVTILDPEGAILFESPALHRILGYRPEEIVGQNVFDFVHPADQPTIREVLLSVLATSEASKAVEFRFKHKHGGWRAMESVGRNLLANPAVRGIIVNSRDITERHEAEAELRKKEAALKSSHEQLQALTAQLLTAEERERRRLSRELHDDLNQKLAVLAVDMGSLSRTLDASGFKDIRKELRGIQARLVRVSEEVRTLAYQLHPSVLDDLGLPVALRSYCAEFSERERIEVRFAHRNMKARIAAEVASCLYRIAQEALRNIAKHAGSKYASVSLVGKQFGITLTIRDVGAGFRLDSVKGRRTLGLTSMAERARLVGGEIDIVSAPGQGTTLRVQVPWEMHSK